MINNSGTGTDTALVTGPIMAKLLVVIGAFEDEDHVKHVVRRVNAGIDHWIQPLPLHTIEEIRSILNSLPSMKSIPNRNGDNDSVVSRFKGRILDTTILINPTLESLHYEFADLLLATSSDCLVVYGGLVSEGETDWILQNGLFAFDNFRHILQESKTASSISDKKIKLAISCDKTGQWKNIEMNSTSDNVHLEIIDSSKTSQDEKKPATGDGNLDSFASFLEESIANEMHAIFKTLKPPRRTGFIKTRIPSLYIFPGGCGDSAYFAIDGFNMLVNGGSLSKPCFWKLVQHIDRIDSIVATHLGADNLPGINSFLMRKLQEQQINLPIDSTSEEYQELRSCLISPQVGPIFINPPSQYFESLSKNSPRKGVPDDNAMSAPNGGEDGLVFKVADVIKETMQLSKALDLKIVPLCRKPGSHEPVTLISKFGCGRLDMYVLNPVEGSKELNYLNEKWGIAGQCKIPVGKNGVFDEASHEGIGTYADLCSIAILLVWHPSDPNEKIVRILFPGNTSQSKIFNGLEGISELPFMKVQHATANIIRAMKEVPKANVASPSQKPPRSASATAKSTGVVQKKSVPTIGKKSAGSSSSIAKESVSSHSKISDKRAKNEKPAMSRSKTVTTTTSATSKAASLKDNAAKSTKSAGRPVSARSNLASASAAKRPQAAASSKSDTKRPLSKTMVATKAKPLEKTSEKSKKPAAAVQKSKANSAKLAAKKSPRQALKKSTSSKITSDKITKVGKDAAQAALSSHQADSPSVEKFDLTSNAEKSQDVCSDDANETVLSERRSPDGRDQSSVQGNFSGVASGSMDVLSVAVGEAKSAVECDKVPLVSVLDKLCISEESDMISTDGGSALSTHPTPVRDTISIPDVEKFDEYISSDKSTPDEQQGGGDHDEKIGSDAMISDEESSEKPVPLANEPTVGSRESPAAETAHTHDIEDVEISQNVTAIDITNAATSQEADNSAVKIDQVKEGQSSKTTGDVEVNEQLAYFSGIQCAQYAGSDVLSSSSAEGSYELCSNGKSLVLASTQETIAETISEFKSDEPVAATEDPTTDIPSQLQQTDAAEEHIISTETFDAPGDASSVLTASVVARIDPLFSSSDASHYTKDPTAEQELEVHHGIAKDNVESFGSQLLSADSTVNGKFELHAFKALVGIIKDLANISPNKGEDNNTDQVLGEPSMSQSESSCLEASHAETYSDTLYAIEESSEAHAKLHDDDSLQAEAIASVTALDEALPRPLMNSEVLEKAEPLENDDIMKDGKCLLEESEFTLHAGLVEGQDVSVKASEEPSPTDDSSVDQRYLVPTVTDPSVDKIDSTGSDVDVDVDHGDARIYASPLNASATPFFPSAMQGDQLQPSDGYEDGAIGCTKHDSTAAKLPASTNPFLLDMMTDSPSTRVEPEELFMPPTRDQDPCAGQDKFGKATVKKPSQARKPASSHVYVDLTYIPNHGDKTSVGLEFFKKIRAQYYVISGSQMSKDQPSMDVLNFLLEARKSWLSEPGKNAGQENSTVTIIPTHDIPSLKEWYHQNFKELEKYNIQLVASDSKVIMPEDSIQACKIVF